MGRPPPILNREIIQAAPRPWDRDARRRWIATLWRSIAEDGVHDPIFIWASNGAILDGRVRRYMRFIHVFRVGTGPQNAPLLTEFHRRTRQLLDEAGPRRLGGAWRGRPVDHQAEARTRAVVKPDVQVAVVVPVDQGHGAAVVGEVHARHGGEVGEGDF